jgi:Heparinase II/III-like protein/Heparinase II/III N-terminus
MDASWYLRRLSRMGPREIVGRAVTAARVKAWRREFDAPVPALAPGPRRFIAVLPDGALDGVPAAARERLLHTAERLMDGHAEYFGIARDDMVAPDWSLDPKTGRRAPSEAYAFDIAYRDEDVVGDIKQLWEPSRHQHLTVLAAAYAVTGDDRYATRVADHLKSWWAAHPPMHGVHWISGIELGIRLLSWVWVRRLLEGWSGAAALFEQNAVAVHQIRMHQSWLAAFPSRGSSANNHVIAEDAGRVAAACAFDWFPESAGWRAAGLRSLDEQLQRNTFPSGLNRELATEYHGLVLELGLAAAAEATHAGVPVPGSVWDVLLRMTDALATVVDAQLRPPRQGDADDGHGLIVDGADTNRWESLLATGQALFGRPDWWPPTVEPDVRTIALQAVGGRPPVSASARPAQRPARLDDAGLTILRAREPGSGEEIWCRCDGGPHGFLSIAAHAHADALSLEVRHDGVEVLADPGTYCYHGEPGWRAYFRSTLAHNTLELDGTDQSVSSGPFLWTRHAVSRVLDSIVEPAGVSRWAAEHDGYNRRGLRAVHRRSVELDAATRRLRILDKVVSPIRHRCRLAFHFGPLVVADRDGLRAELRWSHAGSLRRAVIELPDRLSWTWHRGEVDPPLGWYSAGFGRREPATTLVGHGWIEPGAFELATTLTFEPIDPTAAEPAEESART